MAHPAGDGSRDRFTQDACLYYNLLKCKYLLLNDYFFRAPGVKNPDIRVMFGEAELRVWCWQPPHFARSISSGVKGLGFANWMKILKRLRGMPYAADLSPGRLVFLIAWRTPPALPQGIERKGVEHEAARARHGQHETLDEADPRAICTIAIPVFGSAAFHLATPRSPCVSSARFAAAGRLPLSTSK